MLRHIRAPTARRTPESSTSASPTPTPTTTPTKTPRPKTATIPLVVGKSIPAARAALAAKGFKANVRAVEYSACVKPRVLKQDPPRGSRREMGSK